MIEVAITAAVVLALFGSRYVDVDDVADTVGGLRERAIGASGLGEQTPDDEVRA